MISNQQPYRADGGDNRYEIAEQNGMSREFADWFFDNKKNGCGNAWFMMMAAMWEGWKGLETRCTELAAENALLKKTEPAPFSKLMMEALDIYQAGAEEVPELAMLSAYKKLRDGLKTPATDAFLAEMRAQGGDKRRILYTALPVVLSETAEVARAALDYIDCIPADIAAALPAMPGFDRDWAENVLAEAKGA